MTITHQELIDTYFDCWNATNEQDRSAAVAKAWAPEATSSDPLNEVTGHEDLTSMFAGVQENYPGHIFRQVGDFDTHHSMLRWAWEMLDKEGSPVLDGIDVALLSEDGKLSYLAGFFGANIPALTSP